MADNIQDHKGLDESNLGRSNLCRSLFTPGNSGHLFILSFVDVLGQATCKNGSKKLKC